MNKITFPRIVKDKNSKFYISFNFNNKRYRLTNGSRLGIDLRPNDYSIELRELYAKKLAILVYENLVNGSSFDEYRSKKLITGNLTDIQYLNRALKLKERAGLSKHYLENLRLVSRLINSKCKTNITREDIEDILYSYSSTTTQNMIKRHLSSLITDGVKLGMSHNPLKGIIIRKSKSVIHKPFENIKSIVDEVTAFNDKLGLCCLITYGCLLRPHREVRELTWGDFSVDLKQINLSGARNKSGRNRIVPVPYYIQERLSKGEPHHNIFSGTDKPFAEGYFKTLWRRFKKVSKLLEQDQTLYSFRHSGAIEIYKRTGSLSKLQKAMGHSSLAVSLTYLRGLEVVELEESDMPMI